jgi:hypothetical protein
LSITPTVASVAATSVKGAAFHAMPVSPANSQGRWTERIWRLPSGSSIEE